MNSPQSPFVFIITIFSASDKQPSWDGKGARAKMGRLFTVIYIKQTKTDGEKKEN